MELVNMLGNVTIDGTFTCGNFEFMGILPYLTSTLVTLIQIVIPIILIIMGMLDLGKAIVQQKEDDIKKGQSTFLKRVIAAVVIFLIVAIVKLLVGLVAGNNNDSITECIDCFVSGDCIEK